MKPLVFEFKESPVMENLDYSLIEYDKSLNLSVNKKTRQPAIESLNLDTETFTKSQEEGADSDYDSIRMLMDTETLTFTDIEEADVDQDIMSVKSLIDTTTITSSRESTDKDN